MGLDRFRCTKETVSSIYALFDSIVQNKEFLNLVNSDNTIEVAKDYLGNCSASSKNIKVDLDINTFSNLKAKAISEQGGLIDLTMLKLIVLNNAYFYSKEDIVRCSDYYGLVGFRKSYLNEDIIHEPTNIYKFSDICEVREEYKGLINNSYRKAKLPKSFDKITSNKDYINFFKKEIEKGYAVNSLHERGGDVYCRNMSCNYKSLDYLEGVESDFYNELLEVVVDLGKPVNRVYFYSDLKWTCILYRESKRVKGEYEIVLK